MENPGQNLSNVGVVNQQIIEVLPNVDKTTGAITLAKKAYEEYTLGLLNQTIVFDGGREVVKRVAYIPIGSDEQSANQTLQVLLQNPELISNPILLAKEYQAGRPILINNNVLKGYIFRQEFSVPLMQLTKGNVEQFLASVIKSAGMYAGDSRYRFSREFRKPLLEALRRAVGEKAFETVLDELSNPDTAEFDISLVATKSKEFKAKYAKELDHVFFLKKATKLKKAGANGQFVKENDNFIFWYSFFSNKTEALEFYEDKLVAHTNRVELRKDRRAQRAVVLASETSDDNAEPVTTGADASFEDNSEE